jgi:hypothetical protein
MLCLISLACATTILSMLSNKHISRSNTLWAV